MASGGVGIINPNGEQKAINEMRTDFNFNGPEVQLAKTPVVNNPLIFDPVQNLRLSKRCADDVLSRFN